MTAISVITKLSRCVHPPSADRVPNASVIASLISVLWIGLSPSNCAAIERAASIRRAAVAGAWSVSVSMEGSFHSGRSEEHTSELQSLMRISYAVFCLKKKNNNNNHKQYPPSHM